MEHVVVLQRRAVADWRMIVAANSSWAVHSGEQNDVWRRMSWRCKAKNKVAEVEWVKNVLEERKVSEV